MTAVLFDLDPARTPLIVRRRPVNHWFRPLPPGASESAARPVLASQVRAGDLVVGSCCGYATPYRTTLGATWMTQPYRADPSPWDPQCSCEDCGTVRRVFGPPPPAGRIVMTREPWGGPCDVWDADDIALVIPADFLLLPVSA